jgi:LuxR family maltose regulon positive regulatory protein
MVERTGAARPAPPRGAGHFPKNTNPPRVRPGTIERERLVRRLCTADANEVVIAAPPGYGKTTLAAIWAEQDQRPFGWITIDERDSDPVVFLYDIARALDTVSPGEESLIAELGVVQSPWSAMLPRVLGRVAESPERFVFVMDDVHRMTGSSATEVLPALVENVPPGSAVAIVTRGRIPHPASRGLLAERVFRLGVQDLAMDAREAATLLLAAGVETEQATVNLIHEKTEGWPAGLYMAALALRDADILEHAVRHFSGGDRFVTDYVAEEILHGMAAEDVDFLLATSVLTRLSGALCDEVLGVFGSGATLQRMASENHFVIPLTTTASGIATTTSSQRCCLPKCARVNRLLWTTSLGARAFGSSSTASRRPRSSTRSRPVTIAPLT